MFKARSSYLRGVTLCCGVNHLAGCCMQTAVQRTTEPRVGWPASQRIRSRPCRSRSMPELVRTRPLRPRAPPAAERLAARASPRDSRSRARSAAARGVRGRSQALPPPVRLQGVRLPLRGSHGLQPRQDQAQAGRPSRRASFLGC